MLRHVFSFLDSSLYNCMAKYVGESAALEGAHLGSAIGSTEHTSEPAETVEQLPERISESAAL